MQQVFTPRMVEQLAPRVQAMVDDALDAVVARGDGMDVIADLAFPLPFRVISDMLGMPVAERGAAARLGAHAHARPRAVARARSTMDEILDASDHIIEHVLDAIEWKRAHPADDLLSALIAAEDSTAIASRPTSCSTR